MFYFPIAHPHFHMFLYSTHMASKSHREVTRGREVICRHKIVEVHETYRRSVEMCFGFYDANHLCHRGAFICPPLPLYAIWRRILGLLRGFALTSLFSCGWSYTLKSDVARRHGVSHMKAPLWQR